MSSLCSSSTTYVAALRFWCYSSAVCVFKCAKMAWIVLSLSFSLMCNPSLALLSTEPQDISNLSYPFSFSSLFFCFSGATHQQYVATLDDLGACLQVKVVDDEGFECTAEIGPVGIHAEVSNKTAELLAKGQAEFEVCLVWIALCLFWIALCLFWIALCLFWIALCLVCSGFWSFIYVLLIHTSFLFYLQARLLHMHSSRTYRHPRFVCSILARSSFFLFIFPNSLVHDVWSALNPSLLLQAWHIYSPLCTGSSLRNRHMCSFSHWPFSLAPLLFFSAFVHNQLISNAWSRIPMIPLWLSFFSASAFLTQVTDGQTKKPVTVLVNREKVKLREHKSTKQKEAFSEKTKVCACMQCLSVFVCTYLHCFPCTRFHIYDRITHSCLSVCV